MVGEGDCGAVGGMKIGRGNRSTRRKRAPAPICPPQIPLDRGGKPPTNLLSYGATSDVSKNVICLYRNSVLTEWSRSGHSVITSLHGAHRKHRSSVACSIVAVQLSLLPRIGRCSVVCFAPPCVETIVVSEPFPSNGCFPGSAIPALSKYVTIFTRDLDPDLCIFSSKWIVTSHLLLKLNINVCHAYSYPLTPRYPFAYEKICHCH
jgi:hypothetical protein